MPQVEERPRHPSSDQVATAFTRAKIGRNLQNYYPEIDGVEADSRLGRVLVRLSAALDAAEAEAQVGASFRTDLIGLVPRLRRFALSLTRDQTEADDLVQFTLLKAWEHRARFTMGTNLAGWLFTILRNSFVNGRLKYRREVPDPQGFYAASLESPADQEDKVNLHDLRSALDRLDPIQRQALLLVAVEDLTYEAAAELIGCPAGTVKSRVSRARDKLALELGRA